MKLLFVLIDAFRASYLTKTNTPHLWEMANNNIYVKRIIPCSGFCERSEIFSGLDTLQTKNFTAIGYLPEYSEYKKEKSTILLTSFASKFSPRLANRLFNKYCYIRCKHMKPYYIPRESLHLFSLTEDNMAKKQPFETVFDILEKKGLSYSLGGFTSLADTRKTIRKQPFDFAYHELSKEVDFVPVYVGIIDSKGHEFGNNIKKMEPFLNEVDKKVNELSEYARRKGYSVIVLGDHGMVPVTKKIDIISELDKCRLVMHQDYELFLDSTLARFWFDSDEKKSIVMETLSGLDEYGRFISDDEFEYYGIPNDYIASDGKKVYGDLIWAANPGTIISPDFYNEKDVPINGMHGYLDNKSMDAYGTMIIQNSSETPHVIQELTLSAVCDEICKILEIERPNKSVCDRKR